MDSSSHLRDSVLEQAHEKGRKLLAEAQEHIQTESQERKQRLLQEKSQQRQQQVKNLHNRLQRDIQQIENQKRQSTLVTKQGVLKELFAEASERMAAWSAAEEVAFISQVLSGYDQPVVLTLGAITAEKLSAEDKQALLAQFPQVTLAEAVLAQQAGFVLSMGQIDDNYLYRDLVQSIWEQEGYRMATEIFSDQEN